MSAYRSRPRPRFLHKSMSMTASSNSCSLSRLRAWTSSAARTHQHPNRFRRPASTKRVVSSSSTIRTFGGMDGSLVQAPATVPDTRWNEIATKRKLTVFLGLASCSRSTFIAALRKAAPRNATRKVYRIPSSCVHAVKPRDPWRSRADQGGLIGPSFHHQHCLCYGDTRSPLAARGKSPVSALERGRSWR